MPFPSIPAGYRAVPLQTGEAFWCWRISILARESTAGAPEIVSLWNLPGARAYLGCLLDNEGRVREWLQIWVQNLEDLGGAGAGLEEQSSSAQMDQRWRQHWQAVREVEPAAVVYELPNQQLRPMYLDASQWRVVCPALPQGSEWTLCRDDQELARAGLPKYSESPSRYLRATDAEGAARFAAADDWTAGTDVAPPRSAALGFAPSWLPINPQGAPMAARTHPPLEWEDYIDLLDGATFAEIGARKHDLEAITLQHCLGGAAREGRRHGLMLSGKNATELLYLKLRLLLQAVRAVVAHLREHQCPLLNLDPASFGIWVNPAEDLPWPWTARCELLRPGRAFPLRIPGTDEVRFVALGDSGATAYCPAGRTRRSDLMATIRPIRVGVDAEHQQVSVEGRLSLATPEPVELSDLVRFRFSQGQIPGEFCGTIVAEGPGVRRDIEFRAWPRSLPPAQMAQVKRFEGGKIERCWCELVPALSSPYDSNSLSILGARALISHEKNPLPEVIDALENLGRAASEKLPAGSSLEQVVPVLLELLAGSNDYEPLGIQHLFGRVPDAPQDPAPIPAELWAEALAILLRLMPGLGAVSECADYGAIPSGGLTGPLEKPLAALENLCLRARSLVFSDWNSNREVRAILAELRAGD